MKADDFVAIFPAGTTAPVSYTPSWTGTTNPAIGNGTLAGSYFKVGRWVFYRISVLMGSTTTYGTGAWQFTLPFTADASGYVAGSATMYDASAGNARYNRTAFINTATQIAISAEAPSTFLQATVPFTWASSDFLTVAGWYIATS